MMSNCGNRWSGGFQGGGPVGGGGGGGGAFWIGDFLTMEAAETALTSAEPGAYGDIFVGSVEIANFFGRLQHQLFGAIHHLKMISNCYIERCGALDNSVLDFTDIARVEVISGSLGWDDGIYTSGDCKYLLHFFGQTFTRLRAAAAQCSMWDAVGTPSAFSFAGVGVADPASPAFYTCGGLAKLSSGLAWGASITNSTTASPSSGAPFNIYAAPVTMPTIKSKITLEGTIIANPAASSLSPLCMGAAEPHTNSGPVGTRSIQFGADAYDFTTPVYTVNTAASTTIQSVLEVLSADQMQVPASGY